MLMFGICSALRVYVLWNKDIILFSSVLALNLVPVVANLYLYSFVRPKLTSISFAPCVSYMPLSGHEQIRYASLTPC
ncbi:hypothetical protein PHLGIDRAFT_230800 [Phlebiopsis gigantea 11061_1 CR5-6]|uniref:Uncharacterized protein n=1 Tax=Phlebiopsis gigantea (strain 11061_1 CR5-6) TaxID=745531 RepID=A0A0C3NYE5_PHLG1|nr:hypothetical protein PHLGIDRAFT_230800 [Phlebiopsis gigantea 11061_1 CR5-6]